MWTHTTFFQGPSKQHRARCLFFFTRSPRLRSLARSLPPRNSATAAAALRQVRCCWSNSIVGPFARLSSGLRRRRAPARWSLRMSAVREGNSKMLGKRLHGCLLLLIIFLLANVSGSHAETTVDPDSEDGSKRRSLAASLFCVAKPGADQTVLQMGLNWACGAGQANCAPIQPGGPCYKQNNLEALASYAYNDYYQKNFATGATCSFGGTAMTTTADPSSGQCIFTGSSMAGGGTPAASAPSGGLSPPSTFTPGGIAGSPSTNLIPLDGAESLSSARWATGALLLALPLFFL